MENADILNSILLIISFLAIIIAAYFFTKFLGSRMGQGSSSKYLRIVDRIMIGNDKSICLVQVGTHYYLVGITNHNIRLLAELDDKDLISLQTTLTPFNGLLDKYLNRHRSESKDGNQNRDNKME